MPGYLVEAYVPRARADDARAAGDRARSIAEALSDDGTAVRHIRTAFVPGDETCFYFFVAASAEVVSEVCRRAGIGSTRIVPALE